MDDQATVRGIFAFEDEETPEWRRAVLTEGGIPKFAIKSECEDFIRRHCWRASNPTYPSMQHVFTTLMDWKQIESILYPKMEEYDQNFPPESPYIPLNHQNRFMHGNGGDVIADVDTRLNLSFHRRTNRESTINTLKYMFYETRCGIFVMIRRRRVVLFVPFVNKEYENTWGEHLQFDSSDGTMHQYFREKSRVHGRENYESNPRKWSSNGYSISTEELHKGKSVSLSGEASPQYLDDFDLTQLRDLLESACQHRNVPDCEFFLNKQDYPHLKDNAMQPFGFLFDKDDLDEAQDLPLSMQGSGNTNVCSYAPILSIHTSKRYADIPFPSAVDWEIGSGLLFPRSFQHTHCTQCPCGDAGNCENSWECYCDVADHRNKPHGIIAPRDLFTAANYRKYQIEWDEKIETAFFRGSATGCGKDSNSNQRVHLASLSTQWANDPQFSGKNKSKSRSASLLDAAITEWQPRNIKVATRPVQYLNKEEQRGGGTIDDLYVPLYQQSKYKYIVYVDAACASRRYSYLMKLGSVILKVESTCVAKDLWFSSLLRPFQDHVPVKADLSDLMEKIQWCRDHDDACKEIAMRASELYDQFLCKDAMFDYIEIVCHRIAERFEPAPLWYHRPTGVDSLKKPMLHRPRSMCVGGGNSAHLCRRCQELKEKEGENRDQRQDRNRDQGRVGDRYGNHGGDRGRGRRQYGNNQRTTESAPPPVSTNTVPQCRRCRRVKNACTCSFRR